MQLWPQTNSHLEHALQVAEIRAHSDHLVASAQQAQLLVSQRNEQLQAELAEWRASRQPTSPYGDNNGEIDLTREGQGSRRLACRVRASTHTSHYTFPCYPRRHAQGLHDESGRHAGPVPRHFANSSSAQSKRGRPSADTSPGSHQAGPGSAEPERSRSPSGRDRKKDKKDKGAKTNDHKIRKMRPKHNATPPVQKLNFDNGRPSASRTPLASDVSDFPLTSDHEEHEYEQAGDEA